MRRNVTVQTCLETHLQSILYIDSQGQDEVLYLALIKSKHPQEESAAHGGTAALQDAQTPNVSKINQR